MSAPGYLAEQRPQRIVVFRALVLGDMLCAIPALRALRATLPEAVVSWVGLPSMAEFARRFAPLIDEFIPFPGAVGFPEQRETDEGLPPFFETMRDRRFDLAIQLHGSGGLGNALVRSFGATTLAGFHRADALEQGASGLFLDWDAEIAEPRRYLALMARIGADPAATADASLELPVFPHERLEWRRLRERERFDDTPLVCLHPGARWSSRRWPLERFADVGVALAGRGARLVLTGSADERALGAALAALLRERGVAAVELAGRTSLGALALLLGHARLLVCNDTGISHVAAAVGASSVVIASGSDAARWAPLDARRHAVLAYPVPCRPCMHRECPIDHPCALGTTVDAVLETASRHDFAAKRRVPESAVHVA